MLQSSTSIQGMARSTYLSLHHLRMQLNWYLFAVLPIGSSAIWWLLVIGKLGQVYRWKQRKFEAVRSRIKPKPLDLPLVVMVGSVSKKHFSSLELRCAIKSVSDACKPIKTQDLCYGREDKLPLWAFFWGSWFPTTSYLMVGSKLSPLGWTSGCRLLTTSQRTSSAILRSCRPANFQRCWPWKSILRTAEISGVRQRSWKVTHPHTALQLRWRQ